jgi:hypothetical protein
MKKLSYFFVALFASSVMLLACDGRQGARDDRGRTQDGIYQDDDRGMYRDDQNRQMRDQRQQRDMYEQDTVRQQPGTQQQNF